MERVKIFYSDANDSAAEVERKINAWFKEMGEKIEITRVLQSSSGNMAHHLSVSIFYKTK